MHKSRLATLIDSTAIALSGIILTLVLSSSLTQKLPLKILLAGIVGTILFSWKTRKDKAKFNNQMLKISEEKHLKNCILTLNMMQTNSRNAFLSQIFEIFKKEQNITKLSYFYDFSSEETSLDTLSEILSIVQSKNDKTCVIMTNKLSKSATELFEFSKSRIKTKLVLVNETELYSMMKKANNFPTPITHSIKRFDIKKTLSHFSTFLQREKAKRFFLISIIFFFSSYVVPYNLYYKIFACIALALGAISLCFGKSAKQAPA